MPIFYFDLHLDGAVTRDVVGAEVEAGDVALEAASIVAAHVWEVLPAAQCRLVACEVRDATGRPCHRAEMRFRSVAL